MRSCEVAIIHPVPCVQRKAPTPHSDSPPPPPNNHRSHGMGRPGDSVAAIEGHTYTLRPKTWVTWNDLNSPMAQTSGVFSSFCGKIVMQRDKSNKRNLATWNPPWVPGILAQAPSQRVAEWLMFGRGLTGKGQMPGEPY